jgi:hypothetical protein
LKVQTWRGLGLFQQNPSGCVVPAWSAALHGKEIKRWQRDDQDHQRKARDPERTQGLFRTVRLTFPIFLNPRTRSFNELAEWDDQEQDRQLIAIRIDPFLLKRLRALAAKQKKPYQTFIHEILELAARRAA